MQDEKEEGREWWSSEGRKGKRNSIGKARRPRIHCHKKNGERGVGERERGKLKKNELSFAVES